MNIININSKKWVLTSFELNQLYFKKLDTKAEKIISKFIQNRFGKFWLNLMTNIKYYKPVSFKNIKLSKKLGSGKNGTVYSYKNVAVKKVVSKQYGEQIISGKIEAQIIDYLDENIVQTGYSPCIIWLYQFENIRTVDYLVLEKMDISLWHFLQKSCPEKTIKGIIFQVLFTLAVLQERLPGFRHNDIKIDNILLHISNNEPLQLKFKNYSWILPSNIPLAKISDFDYSFIPGKISNPKVLLAQKSDFGCSKIPSKIYDTHLFLNSVYKHRNHYSKNVSDWIKEQFSELGEDTTELKFGRLKDPTKWENIFPNPKRLLVSPFFKEFRNTLDKKAPFWGF